MTGTYKHGGHASFTGADKQRGHTSFLVTDRRRGHASFADHLCHFSPTGTADAFQTPSTSPSSPLSPVSPGNAQPFSSPTHPDLNLSPERTPSPTTAGPVDCLSSDGVGYKNRNAPVALRKPSDGPIIPCKRRQNSTSTSPVQVEPPLSGRAGEAGVEQGLLHECVVSLGLCVTDEKTHTLSGELL